MVKNIPTIERSTKIRFGKHATDDQAENTIVFNASNVAIDASTAGGVYMTPLRQATIGGATFIGYDSTTKEIVDTNVLTSLLGGISLDDVSSHKDFSNAYKLPFTILADVNQEASKAYKVLGGFGPMEYAERETFIIDPQGNIVYHYPDVDPDTHAKEVYKQLKILQKELEG